jgi:hypothetical protein
MSFFKRLEGIFFGPKPVFQALAEKPVWVDALVVLLIIMAVFACFVLPYSQNDQAQMFRDNVKLKERLGETRFNEMMAKLDTPPTTAGYIRSVVLGPGMFLIGALFSSLILLMLGRFLSSQGRYIQVLAVVLHANFVDKLLGNGVRTFLIATRKSVMQTSTSLALIFPKMEVATPAYVVLSQVDFFQLWMFGLIGLGLSAIFKVDVKKALIVSYGFWLLKSALYIGMGMLGLKYMS